MKQRNLIIWLLLSLALAITGCKKFLDEKPDKKLVIPKNLTDLQALLDNANNMNLQTPGSGEASSDNNFLPDGYYDFLEQWQKNLYIWEKESIPDKLQNDWSITYLPVYYSNIVLEQISDITRDNSNKEKWDNVKGSALFYRSKYFFDALELWAKAYDKNTASTDDGIPLRLSSNFNEQSVRSSVLECYNRIVADLKEAEILLPSTPAHLMRPSKSAVFALLSRVYLSQQDYDNALLYADKCVQAKGELIDFNMPSSDYDPNSHFPIKMFNREVIMHFRMSDIYWWLPYSVDTNLINLYSSNDIRKQVYFEDNGDGTINCYRSTYDAEYYVFSGFATDEMYLTRAECYARKGNTAAAMTDLNALLVKRYDNTFVPLTATDPTDALNKILLERRKELLIRGTRWMDLKRLNKEGASILLSKIVNGQTYSLPPNDNRYALPIPNNIISTSGIQQNPR